MFAMIESPQEILVSDRGVWSATPWIYSSCRFLHFENDQVELVYGYGQTIYSKILAHWTVLSCDRLRLAYLDSPPLLRFPGYTPSTESVRELKYTLKHEDFSGVESTVSQPFSFKWILELSTDPWPLDITFPHDFYGHRQVAKPSLR
jgi:hypothetical protein